MLSIYPKKNTNPKKPYYCGCGKAYKSQAALYTHCK